MPPSFMYERSMRKKFYSGETDMKSSLFSVCEYVRGGVGVEGMHMNACGYNLHMGEHACMRACM